MNSSDRELCMNFSNAELKSYLIDKMTPFTDVKCIVNDQYVSYDCNDDFEYITFDGTIQEFYISLHKFQTCIFINNEEIMFIDDEEKKHYTWSDVESCIVYEGNLFGKTHKQILELIMEFLNIFRGSSNMIVKKEIIQTDEKCSYTKYKYYINVNNPNVGSGKYQFDNIIINVVQ
ncbi:MAG: hypothetical protein IJ079_08115 [Lachnospiraceae bacterium]|nr:hypothetical protein [Lachnospiraceae bacterium]